VVRGGLYSAPSQAQPVGQSLLQPPPSLKPRQGTFLLRKKTPRCNVGLKVTRVLLVLNTVFETLAQIAMKHIVFHAATAGEMFGHYPPPSVRLRRYGARHLEIRLQRLTDALINWKISRTGTLDPARCIAQNFNPFGVAMFHNAFTEFEHLQTKWTHAMSEGSAV